MVKMIAALEGEQPIQILVVEDEPDVANLIVKLLKKTFDVEVDLAQDLGHAREKLLSSEFDLVTLDYLLPDGYSTELMRMLPERPSRPAVIVVTGHGDEKVAAAFRGLGVDGFIIKNEALPGRLTEVVGRLLGAMAQA